MDLFYSQNANKSLRILEIDPGITRPLIQSLRHPSQSLESLIKLGHSCTSPPSLYSLALGWKDTYNALILKIPYRHYNGLLTEMWSAMHPTTPRFNDENCSAAGQETDARAKLANIQMVSSRLKGRHTRSHNNSRMNGNNNNCFPGPPPNYIKGKALF